MDPLGMTNVSVLIGVVVLTLMDLHHRPGSRSRRIGQWLLAYLSLYTLSRAVLLRDMPPPVMTMMPPVFPLLVVGLGSVIAGFAWTETDATTAYRWTPYRVFSVLGVVGYGLLAYYLLFPPRLPCVPLGATMVCTSVTVPE